MKKNKLAVACMAALLGMTLAGCKSDDPVEPGSVDPGPDPVVPAHDLSFNTETSPVAQNWTPVLSGTASGYLVDDTQPNSPVIPAWYVDGRGGIAEWKSTPEGDFNAMASQNGWTMAFTMRVESGTYITNYYGNGSKRFLSVIKLEGNNLIVQLEGGITQTLVEGVADDSAAKSYHDYVISYDPVTGKATFKFDDEIISDDWQGANSNHNTVSWGNAGSGVVNDSEAYYQNFTFDIPDYQHTPSFKLFKADGESGDDGSKMYRLPAIQSAMGDYVFAFAEGHPNGDDPGGNGEINLSAKFSSDGGETWTQVKDISTYMDPDSEYDFSDPRPIYNENTEELTVFYTQWPTNCAQNGDCITPDGYNRLLSHSFDFTSNTWGNAVDITDQTRVRAWDVRGWGGSASWKYEIPDNIENANPTTDTWSLITERKVIQGKITDYFTTGEKIFLPNVTLAENNDLMVEFNGDANGPYTLIEGVGPANFYTSEIRYNPNTGTASYIFNNETILENWAGTPNSSKQVIFGNDLTYDEGRASYKSVSFNIGNTSVIDYDASIIPAASADPIQQGWTKYTNGTGAGILGWKSVNSGPGNGIQLKWQTDPERNGRMLMPAIILDGYGHLAVKSVYSDDNGENWKTGGYAMMPYAWSGNSLQQAQASESDVVELIDGRLLLTTRNDGHRSYGTLVNGQYQYQFGSRMQFLSDNGGETWTYKTDSELPTDINAVDASLIRYSGSPTDSDSMLLFSAPTGGSRHNLGIWSSIDEGATWNGPKQVWTGESWYSDMTMLPDGKVGILVETGGFNITLLKKDISELLPEPSLNNKLR